MTTTALSRASLDAALDLTLTDEQWAAVRSEFAPAVIVAGAGSGKTTSMAARVAWLVGSGYVRPDQVLGLTFTTKATAQLLSSMRSSVSALVDAGIVDGETAEGDPIGEPQVLTYHAFSARIWPSTASASVAAPDDADDGARQQLAYRVVCRSSLPLAGIGRSPLPGHQGPAQPRRRADGARGVAGRPARVRRRHGRDAAVVRAAAADRHQDGDHLRPARAPGGPRHGVACGQGRARRARLRRPDPAGRRIVHTFPDVVADLRARYAVVLLDDVQDASIAQRVLLPADLRRGPPRHGGRRSVPGHLRLARSQRRQHRGLPPEHFPAGGDAAAARFTLSQNRRSGVSILEVANRTSAHLRTCMPASSRSTAGVNGKGQAVSCALFETYAQETEWVVGEIEATHSARGAGRAVPPERHRGAGGHGCGRWSPSTRRSGDAGFHATGRGGRTHGPAGGHRLAEHARARPRPVRQPGVRAARGRSALAEGRATSRPWATAPPSSRAGGTTPGQDDIGSALDDAVAGTDVVESISLTKALDDLGDIDRYSREAAERFAAMARELRDLRRHVGEPLPEFVLRVMRVTGLEVEAALGSPDAAAQQQHALHAFLDLTADFTELDGRLTWGRSWRAFATRSGSTSTWSWR